MLITNMNLFTLLILLLHGNYVFLSENTLQLVHVVFRHGDRTNDVRTIYPNDPYKNETYHPYGLGQLTDKGKMKMYELGKYLKNKYGKFLGDIYSTKNIHSRCSSYSRTKISLMLLMSGLFLPNDHQIWNNNLLWQPITFNYKLKMHDVEYFGITCPNYYKHYFAYYNTPTYQNYLKKYENLFQYLTIHTGWNVTTLERVNYIYVCLQIEEHWGFKLPEWTNSVWPKIIKEANHDYYHEATANTNLTKYAIGFLLKKILNDTQNKINGLTPEIKLYIYSAHDYNLTFMLKVIGLLNLKLEPTYASFMAIELHKVNGTFALKFFYENYTNDKKYLDIPNCGTLCSFKKFMELMSESLPSENDLCGSETVTGHVNENL